MQLIAINVGYKLLFLLVLVKERQLTQNLSDHTRHNYQFNKICCSIQVIDTKFRSPINDDLHESMPQTHFQSSWTQVWGDIRNIKKCFHVDLTFECRKFEKKIHFLPIFGPQKLQK